MGNQYFDDLVQNIYTKCDMSGFDDYNRGVKSLSRNMASFNADSIRGQKARISLVEAETKSQIRLADYQNKYANKKRQADNAEIGRMQKRNGLQRYFTRLIIGAFSLHALKGMFDTASRLQLVQKSIQGLTKSTQDWDYIQKQAFEKGIDIEVVAKGYRNFYSSAKMAGFDKGGIQQMYADMLLSTRAIGASTQQTEGALLALEQMLSKGRVSMEELRRQLGNALPGAFEIGAKAMNMTTMEFNKFVRTGQLASSEFVPKFIAQLKKEYAGGFKDVAETLSFATTRLSVAWKTFQLRVFEGESGKSFARAIDTLAKLLVSPEFERVAKAIGKIFEIVADLLKFAIENISFVIALLGSMGLTKIIITLNGLIGTKSVLAVMKLTKATALLYGQWLLVFALVSAIQDMIYGIFMPEVTDSVTERILKNLGIYKEPEQPTTKQINKQIDTNTANQLSQGMVDPKTGNILYLDKNGVTRLMSSRDFQKYGLQSYNDADPTYRRAVLRKYGDMGNFAPHQLVPRMADPNAIPAELNKTETKNLTMGDVNIYVQGNKDPNTTAQSVFDSFFSLRRKFFQDK